MDLTNVFQLLNDHKWQAVAVLVLGYLVRLLQCDTKVPLDLPVKFRIPVEMILAIATGVVGKLEIPGTTWQIACAWGAVAGLMLVTGRTSIQNVTGQDPALFVPLKAPEDQKCPATASPAIKSTGSTIITPIEIPVVHVSSVADEKNDETKPL
jgi:hypothetical protein